MTDLFFDILPIYDPNTVWAHVQQVAGAHGKARRAANRFSTWGLGRFYLNAVLWYLQDTYGPSRSIDLVRMYALGSWTPSTKPLRDFKNPNEDYLSAVVCATYVRLLRDESLTEGQRLEHFGQFVVHVASYEHFSIRCLAGVYHGYRTLGFQADIQGREALWGHSDHCTAVVIHRALSKHSVDDVLAQVLGLWSPHDPALWFWCLRGLIHVLSEKEGQVAAVQVLNYLVRHELAQEYPARYARAAAILDGAVTPRQGWETGGQMPFTFEAERGLFCLVANLVSSLPTSLDAQHLYLRWLITVSNSWVQEVLTEYPKLPSLSGWFAPEGIECIDDMMGQLWGDELWKMSCERQLESAEGSPTQERAEALLEVSRHEDHKPDVAEPLERFFLLAPNCDADACNQVAEGCLGILSGPVFGASTTTHLRSTWMPVQRRSEELFSEDIERIELRRHDDLGESGPACHFRFFVSGSSEYVRGSLDSEGELYLDDVVVLHRTCRAAVRAIVLETVMGILVPELVDGVPDAPNGNGLRPENPELSAHRPKVHIEGILDSPDLSSPSTGTKRMHPKVAQWLCEWLLGLPCDVEFDLFERVGKPPRHCFHRLADGKKALDQNHDLDSVFIRAIRAFTVPVGALLVGEKVVVRSPSRLAGRRYEQYRKDGGRPLDLSLVAKTYTVVGHDNPVVVNVPRTFNHGTFVTLREALDKVHDRGLKERVLRKFG